MTTTRSASMSHCLHGARSPVERIFFTNEDVKAFKDAIETDQNTQKSTVFNSIK